MRQILSKAQTDQLAAGSCRDRMIVAMTVRMVRAALGWSQAELGRLLGMSQRAIHRIEQGHSVPRRTTLLAIENLLNKAGLKIEDRGDGGFCISVPASILAAPASSEEGIPVNVAAPSLSDPGSGEGEGETIEPESTELLR